LQRYSHHRYPKQYWLRRRIAQREPKPEGDFLPWDFAEFSAHHNPHLLNLHLIYGSSFDNCLTNIDPTLTIQLMKDDFISTTKVKERSDRDKAAFVAATYLQGEDSKDLNKFAYWGEQNKIITPIVIDTGASISISGLKGGFYDSVELLDPNTEIQGLNHSIKVSGIGKVKWTIHNQIGHIKTISTTAYYIPEANIRLFSLQLYFHEIQGGKLTMDHKKTMLLSESGRILSFPIHFTNNLPMMFPDEASTAKHCLFGYNLNEEVVFFGVTDDRNNNLSGPEKELLQWHFNFVHIGM
jgi:hypothetical protein